MADLQEFFDYFTCKVCFQAYGANHTPFIICKNHHLLCNNCVSVMIDANSEREFKSTLECPFCKDHMEFTEISQDRQVLQIKEIVAKIKRQEQNQKDENTFLRNKCAKSEEQIKTLKEKPCIVHAKKASQKKLVCYCKNKYFSNPIEEIKAHIESISELMKLIKKRQQDKMILNSILQDQPNEHSFCQEAPNVEKEQSVPLSQRQEKIEIEKLADKFQQWISESLKTTKLMGQMLATYRQKQSNLRDRQKWLDQQLKEKEAQINKEAQQQILQYRMVFQQQLKNIRSNMDEARQELRNTIQILSKQIKDKNDEIRSLKKQNDSIKQKHKLLVNQLNSKFQQYQGKFQENVKKQSRSTNHIEGNAGHSENLQKIKGQQPKKMKRRIAIQSNKMPSNKRLEARNVKEQINVHIPKVDSEKKGPSRQSRAKIPNLENIMSKK